MESTLFVPAKLTFSENLRCLNLPLPVGAVSKKRLLSETLFVFAGQIVHGGKFKYLINAENVNFTGTNNVDSILVVKSTLVCKGMAALLKNTNNYLKSIHFASYKGRRVVLRENICMLMKKYVINKHLFRLTFV